MAEGRLDGFTAGDGRVDKNYVGLRANGRDCERAVDRHMELMPNPISWYLRD